MHTVWQPWCCGCTLLQCNRCTHSTIQIHLLIHFSQIEVQGSFLSNSSTHLSWAVGALSHTDRWSTHQVLLTDVIPSHLWKWWMYQISDWMYEPQATLFGPLRKISHRPESIHKVEGKEIKRDMVAWGMRTHFTRFWHRIQPCELKDTSLVSPGYLVRVQWWDLFSASWVFLTIKWNLIGYVILFSCKKKRKKDQIKDGET